MRMLLGIALIAGCCSSVSGQVVQLPSVSTFGTTGAVSVPDQGTAYLAGNRSLRSGATSSGFGPIGSRAIGAAAGGSMVSVSATIIDLQAMDEALLNRSLDKLPPRNYPAMNNGTPIINTLAPKNYSRMAQRTPRNAHNSNDWAIALGSPGDDVVDTSSVENNVRYFMSQAAKASAAGRVAAAQVYYRMAMDRMTRNNKSGTRKIKDRNAEAARRWSDARRTGEGKLAKEAAATAATSSKKATAPAVKN